MLMFQTTHKPRPSRLAPWFYAFLVLGLFTFWYVANREPWIGPLFVVGGAAIAVQGFDALRTGRLAGYLPNLFPIHADRSAQPLIFWSTTIIYLLFGMFWFIMGILGIFERLSGAA